MVLNSPALLADLGVRGIWQTQTEALYVHVIDTDTRSYVSRSVKSVLESAEREKKYQEAAMNHHVSFTPFVVSVDGVKEREASSVINRLGEKLAFKCSRPFSTTLNWIRARMAFAIIRATNR